MTKGGYFCYENSEYTKNVTGKEHYHSYCEIYYLEKGVCNYFIEGKSYEVREGDVVLIPARVIHSTSYVEGYRTRKLLYCSDEYIPSEVVQCISSLARVYRSPLVSARAKEIFEKIETEYGSTKEYSETALEIEAASLFLLLARNQNEVADQRTVNRYVSLAAEYINENYAFDISLAAIAGSLSVCPEHLSRMFKRETCIGFSEYLTLVRLKRAEELLKSDSGLSVTEIAYASGFNDSNYFSKKFKERYGVSPTEYRKM